ncbi:hypothetical protein HC251_20985 [Iamia sp. SCSIO 61187]|uniref:hypothetical protein n=1 Tax=Iamia sp. SCSIO 61187 TaxID=2722752 RepID=UPI001C62ADD7|nr:hypothetical protein [Iamia sp. SCSIO 61187]QYG94664.1 hypothetical protein HC251_20985 [Iamia sp. SCSIO 61187]
MTRRPLLWIAAVASVVGVALALPPAAGAADPGWDLTIDDHPDVVDARPVRVTGRASFLGPLGVLAPVRAVTVALVPGDGLPEACRVAPVSVVPRDGRYDAAVEPECNGPHRVSVTARTDAGSSGAPVTEPVGLAWAGPAPAPPNAIVTATGALVSWPGTAAPDVVGWTLVDVGTYPRDQTSVAVAAAPGPHAFRLAAVRWGAEGPDGPTVTSPPSSERGVTVPTPQQAPAPPDRPAPDPPAPAPRAGGGGSPSPTGGTAPPAGPRRTGPPTRGTGSTATLPEGYSEELPYGVPDDAFVPGEEPAAASEGAAEETAAGTSPSASLVRTREKEAPGLVGPFALGLLLVTVATHIGWYLRRSRPGRDEQVSLL